MRRGNKSHKVPNVKLRPAQPVASSSKQPLAPEDSWWAQDTQCSTMGDPNMVDSCPRPFRGVVLCATGISDKPTLFKQAIELGAVAMPAFTDRVTHLVAVEHGGAKYMCALERKIPILQPSWVTESYEIWLRGDDVDFAQSVEAHRLPVFSGVILSLSGIDDITRRTQINKLVTSQKGVYVKNLERPIKVTHLLCAGDEETDKMRYADKFNKRREARIHLVWEEWFWDSLEFGGRFDESKYEVRHPRPERKSIADVVPSSSPSHPPSSALPDIDADIPPRSSSPPLLPPHVNEGDEDDQLVSAPRVPALTLRLWESLLKPRGFEIADGRLVRSPSKSQSQQPPHPAGRNSPPSPLLGARVRGNGGESILSGFRRTTSFAPPPAKDNEQATRQRQLFKRTATVPALTHNLARENVAGPSNSSFMIAQPIDDEAGPSVSSSATSLFAGLRFRALGEAKGPSVRSAIEGCGGRMVADDDEDGVDHVIVRLVSGSKFYRQETDEHERAKYRTECWLERCLFEERICTPEEHLSFTPLNIEVPVTGADDVRLSFSGLDQSEACWIRRLIRALGINLAPNFSRRSTHLLCPSATGGKYDKALEWGVPVVDMRWLAEMASTGLVPPVAGGGGRKETVAEEVEAMYGEEMEIAMAVDKDDLEAKGRAKGKGKEKIIDITNSSQSDDDRPPTQAAEHVAAGRHPRVERADTLPMADESRQQSTSTPPPPSRSTTLDSKSSFSDADRGSKPPTLAEIKRDMQTTRIPSSKSPSPLKVLRVGAEPSPVRMPGEVTKALQDGLTTLLGKRQASEDELGAQQGKAGKRVRPRPHHKSKPMSRQTSNDVVPGPIDAPLPLYDRSLSPFGPDEMNIFDGDGRGAEESVRVTYEDPGQREEKRRLMSLFGGHTDGGTDGAGKGADSERGRRKSGSAGLVRRSTRIAGF